MPQTGESYTDNTQTSIIYTLVRSRRKTLAIFITKGATVEVRAPLHMPIRYIEKFIEKKAKWIETRLAMRVKVNKEKVAFSLHYGDKSTMLGHAYPITAREGNKYGFDGTCFYLPPRLPPDMIKSGLIRIYKAAAKQIISEKMDTYAKLLQVSPARFRITSAKTRWGSCSAKKNLNFSWRLVFAEDSVVNYVVIHELAHLLELNHSTRFWAHVEKIIPDYTENKAKLRKLQKSLAAQDWD